MSPILQSIANGSAQGYGAFFGAGGGGSFESLATFTGVANTTTFTSIPSTFQHLQLRINYLEPNGGQSLTMRLNGDTGSNYVWHGLEGNGTTASAYGFTAQNAISIFSNNITGTVTGHPNTIIVDIHDYKSTTKNKTVRVFAGGDRNATGGTVQLLSGLWMNTSAITSLTVRDPSSLNWSAATSIALYGIKGA